MQYELLTSRAIRGMYALSLSIDAGTSWLDGVSNFFPSDQVSETYNFLGMTPAMREWIGARQAKGFSGQGITIVNKHYEGTLIIGERDRRLDKTGQLQIRMNDLRTREQTHWSSLVSTLVVNGATALCYDGQYFFDTDHSEGDSGNQSNKIDADISTYPAVLHGSAASDPSVEEMQQAIIAGIVKMLSFVDDRGEPMNENANSFLVMVPVGLLKAALGAVSTLIPAMMQQNLNPNLLRNFKIEVAVNVRLTAAGWTDKFVIFRTDDPIRALIRQQEKDVEPLFLDESSDFYFETKCFKTGIDAWRGCGYGFWQRAIQVTLV